MGPGWVNCKNVAKSETNMSETLGLTNIYKFECLDLMWGYLIFPVLNALIQYT